MSTLKGIASLVFDCKTATISMTAGATLLEREVIEALKKAGFAGEGFTSGAPPTRSVVELEIELLARDARFDQATCGALELQLAAALPAATEWRVGADGKARGRFAAPPPTATELEATLAKALASASPRATASRVRAESTRLVEWPESAARATVTLAAPLAASQWQPVAEAIASLEQVLAWSPGGDGETLMVWTKEPCANLATRLRGVLSPLSISVSQVDS